MSCVFDKGVMVSMTIIVFNLLTCRYYISISRAKQSLPESSPLSRSTVELLQSAKSKILQ